MRNERVRSVETTTHGRVLLDVPALPGPHRLLVGFHGYGENAERHLEQLRRLPGLDAWALACVQGLHRFYAPKTEEIVASWMTRQDREQAIGDNVAYIDRVFAVVTADLGTPSRLVYAGFSQGVAMAFRAATLGTARADGIIALGGDVPPDVCERPAARFGRVLLGRGTRDTWYTEAKLQADLTQLRSLGVGVEAVVFDGGHEWTDAVRAAASQFLHTLAPP
jgi:predicted esterase